ncbi:MAG TPA: glycosyltransferase, partial [Anaerolineae bacterium]|nr:glycosyltransferase [Anaerolineae bacterium]
GREEVALTVAQPLVSAIVSTYNSERFIRGCLEDLEAQTIADRLEIIVVDSGSQQNERAIVEEFQQRYDNIVYIRTEERETVYAAWNRGIKAARGKYITNANTDDRHRRDALELLARALDEHPDITVVYADCAITHIENQTFDTASPTRFFRWPDFDRETFFQVCTVGPQPMWRREVHNEYGFFDESFQVAGDYEFWLRISKTRKFLHLPIVLGLYFESPTSIEHRDPELARRESERARALHRDSLRMPVGPDIEKEKPVVSVIVPTYNRPHMLVEAVRSILQQTYQNFEIIVVNDGGADAEGLIRFLDADNRITYVRHNRQRGPGAARNTGLRLARGKYIAYLDDDDIYYPEHLETLVSYLEQNPVRVAYTDAYRAVQKSNNGRYETVARDQPYGTDFDRDHLLVWNYIPMLCLMHERACLETAGLFDEDLDMVEDWDLLIRLSQTDDFVRIPRITAEFSARVGDDHVNIFGTNALVAHQRIYSKYAHLVANRPDIQAAQAEGLAYLKRQTSGSPGGFESAPTTTPSELTASMIQQVLGREEPISADELERAAKVLAGLMSGPEDAVTAIEARREQINGVLLVMMAANLQQAQAAGAQDAIARLEALIAAAKQCLPIEQLLPSGPESSQTESRLCSIIIPVRNGLAYLRQCVDSIRERTQFPYELIFVDNGSDIATRRYLESIPDATVLTAPEDDGLVRGYNQGIAHAHGDYLVLLDHDVVVTDGWLTRLVQWAESEPGVGLVGPMTNRIVGPQQASGVTYSNLDELHDYFATLFRELNRGRGYATDSLAGFCLLLKRAVVDVVGEFDEHLGLGNFEDDDYCQRAQAAGFTLVMAGDVFVHHFNDHDEVPSLDDLGVATAEPASLPGGNGSKPAARVPETSTPAVEDSTPTAELSSGPAVAAYLQQADTLVAEGQFEAALDVLKQAATVAPDDAVVAYTTGVILRHLNLNDEAITYFQRTAELAPDFADAFHNLGLLKWEQGDLTAAAADLNQAVTLDAGNLAARKSLAAVYFQAERYTEGVQTYVSILRDFPADVETYVTLADCYLAVDQPDSARILLEEALRLDPNNLAASERLDTLSAKESP